MSVLPGPRHYHTLSIRVPRNQNLLVKDCQLAPSCRLPRHFTDSCQGDHSGSAPQSESLSGDQPHYTVYQIFSFRGRSYSTMAFLALLNGSLSLRKGSSRRDTSAPLRANLRVLGNGLRFFKNWANSPPRYFFSVSGTSLWWTDYPLPVWGGGRGFTLKLHGPVTLFFLPSSPLFNLCLVL